jgi:hypothetical protein
MTKFAVFRPSDACRTALFTPYFIGNDHAMRRVVRSHLLRLTQYLCCALFAGAQETPAIAAAPPLRTIVYDVTYMVSTTAQEQGSAGAAQRSSLTTDRGKLTVDIVAAPEDGRLIVDAAFAGDAPDRSAVRVAISKSGDLSADPATPVSAAAVGVLPLLARGLLVGRDVSPGSTWDVAAAAPSHGTISYRVLHSDDERATLAVAGGVSIRRPDGFDSQSTATVAYDTVRLCPLHYDVTTVVRRQTSMSRFVTSTTHLVADLVSDSFANRKRP